jgi:hypothetical protein
VALKRLSLNQPLVAAGVAAGVAPWSLLDGIS